MENEKDQLLYQLQELENEKNELEEKSRIFNDAPYNRILKQIQKYTIPREDSLNNGGKKKSRRKLRKRGRKTKRRK